jgi:hypothetical protein
VVDDTLPPPVPRPRLTLTTRLALIALACAFVASFLPWVRVLFISVNGTDGDGVITLVTSAIGFGLVIASERAQTRSLVWHSGAIISAAVTTLVFVYNLADASHAAGDSADALFDLQVSPQFGLIAGAVAAPIALLAAIVRLRDHLSARTGVPSAPRMPADLLAGSLAVSALPFALSPSLWAISALLVIALSLVLWFGTRPRRIRMMSSVLAVIGLVIAAAGTVYGLLDSNEQPGLSSALTDSLQGIPVEDLEDCDDIYTAGTPTIDDATLCLDNGVETYVFPITWDCKDGRTLVSNDYGWGYVGDTWSTVGEAPFDRCRSIAEMSCTDIFINGETTPEEWSDDYIECFDDDGEIDYVITTRWDCYDSDEVQLSNRYGWGYIGKEWIAGDEAPFC